MAKHKTHYEECDVLVVGGGMAGTGATFEARHWGRDLKSLLIDFLGYRLSLYMQRAKYDS